MHIELLRPSELQPRHLEAWRRLQAENPSLDRAFLSPEYVQALGGVRDDVEVAVLEAGQTISGFFPFQRVSSRVARAPGLRLCDFQGLVAPPHLDVDVTRLLRACGLHAWRFDHVLDDQVAWRRWHVSRSESAYVDLRAGYEAYLAERRAAGAGWVSQVQRKARKMAREVGELCFRFDCRDEAVLNQVLSWKSAQRERTRTEDVLKQQWVRESLRRMLDARGPTFACVLSALYAGKRLVAGHLGLRSGRSLHVWFPAFDLEYETYSPGLLMFTEMYRAAAAQGLESVDLGKGDERYKQSMGSASISVAEGYVDVRRLHGLVRRAWYTGRARYHATPLAGLLRGPKRRLRRVINRLAAAW